MNAISQLVMHVRSQALDIEDINVVVMLHPLFQLIVILQPSGFKEGFKIIVVPDGIIALKISKVLGWPETGLCLPSLDTGTNH